jgi:hypothetical protein
MKVNIRKYNRGPTERRIDVQIDKWDTYSLDHSIALIILPALIQLKQTKHGVPNQFVSRVGGDMDSNYCFDFIKEDENQVFDQGCAKWEETLDKMIWSFQQLVMDDYSNKYHHGEMKVGWKPSGFKFTNPLTGKDEETFEMVDENPGEHWYDFDGHMLHEERIQEGIDLFAKHFRDLWD